MQTPSWVAWDDSGALAGARCGASPGQRPPARGGRAGRRQGQRPIAGLRRRRPGSGAAGYVTGPLMLPSSSMEPKFKEEIILLMLHSPNPHLSPPAPRARVERSRTRSRFLIWFAYATRNVMAAFPGAIKSVFRAPGTLKAAAPGPAPPLSPSIFGSSAARGQLCAHGVPGGAPRARAAAGPEQGGGARRRGGRSAESRPGPSEPQPPPRSFTLPRPRFLRARLRNPSFPNVPPTGMWKDGGRSAADSGIIATPGKQHASRWGVSQ